MSLSTKGPQFLLESFYEEGSHKANTTPNTLQHLGQEGIRKWINTVLEVQVSSFLEEKEFLSPLLKQRRI